MAYSLDNLLLLKEIFYSDVEYDSENVNKFNSALNLFFGYSANEGPNWKMAFKDYIEINSHDTAKRKKVSRKDLLNIPAEQIIQPSISKRNDIRRKLNTLYEKVKFSKTLIYEAPPYKVLIKNTQPVNEVEFVAEYILDTTCGGPYSNAILNCFNQPAKSSISETLRKNQCGFFDLIPMPLPISSDLRNLWATDERFIIDGKRILVYFFEWAVEEYLEKAKILPTNSHALAVGVPLNNAVTLYEFFAGPNQLFFNKINIDFNAPHTNSFLEKKEGLWLNLFKNCIIASSNTPTGELMKIAFS